MSGGAHGLLAPSTAARRLFFAFWPEPRVRAELASTFAATAAAAGNAVPAGNLHVTLEFLGAVPAHRLDELAELGAALELPAAEFVFDTLEWWPRPALLVARPTAAPRELLDLQEQLRLALGARGFRVDERAYRPHLTLARHVSAEPIVAAAPRARWPVRELALVESAPSVRGVRYTPLVSWSR